MKLQTLQALQAFTVLNKNGHWQGHGRLCCVVFVLCWCGGGVVWCGGVVCVWCGCGVVWCGVVWCGVVWCGVCVFCVYVLRWLCVCDVCCGVCVCVLFFCFCV